MKEFNIYFIRNRGTVQLRQS